MNIIIISISLLIVDYLFSLLIILSISINSSKLFYSSIIIITSYYYSTMHLESSISITCNPTHISLSPYHNKSSAFVTMSSIALQTLLSTHLFIMITYFSSNQTISILALMKTHYVIRMILMIILILLRLLIEIFAFINHDFYFPVHIDFTVRVD